METPAFASLMGRPDKTAMTVGPAYMSPAAEVSLQGSGGAGLMQIGADFQGRVSAGMLAALVVGLAGFYIWTRGFQA